MMTLKCSMIPGLGNIWTSLFRSASTFAAETGEADASYLQASPDDLRWWRDARFGQFISWSVASMKGQEMSVSRNGRYGGLDRVAFKELVSPIPVDEYDALYKQFNPAGFNADEWAATIKAAGARYVVFTTKHCDGFCMFDSKLTDYKITNTPFGRDVTAELAAAVRRAGLKMGFYYSPADWHHPDYRTENHGRYKEYLRGQLRELCSNYGPVSILWFDDLWAPAEDWDSPELFAMIRQLQPGILINNRAGLPGDYDTPEGIIGGDVVWQEFPSPRPWETCSVIGTGWGWITDDKARPLKECIDTLVRCVGGDGNLLLNIGPRPDGVIDPAQAARLREVGEWLAKYGESVYGTRGGPWRPGPWTVSTHRGNTVYFHVLKWQEGDLYLPRPWRKILSSRLLTGGALEVIETSEAIRLKIAPRDRQELDTIIVFELDSPAGGIRPLHPARIGFWNGDLP